MKGGINLSYTWAHCSRVYIYMDVVFLRSLCAYGLSVLWQSVSVSACHPASSRTACIYFVYLVSHCRLCCWLFASHRIAHSLLSSIRVCRVVCLYIYMCVSRIYIYIWLSLMYIYCVVVTHTLFYAFLMFGSNIGCVCIVSGLLVRSSTFMTSPPLAQLVERETVVSTHNCRIM